MASAKPWKALKLEWPYLKLDWDSQPFILPLNQSLDMGIPQKGGLWARKSAAEADPKGDWQLETICWPLSAAGTMSPSLTQELGSVSPGPECSKNPTLVNSNSRLGTEVSLMLGPSYSTSHNHSNQMFTYQKVVFLYCFAYKLVSSSKVVAPLGAFIILS